MPRTFLRFGLVLGLLTVLFINTGGFSCSASSDDPLYYNPPVFDLNVQNNDSVAVDVFIDTIFQDFVDPYGLLIITEVDESPSTELFADAQDGSGDWGPDYVDTTNMWTYDWVLDPIEWFTLTIINIDIWVGGDIYVDGELVGAVPADSLISIDNLPTNAATEVEVVAFDLSWAYPPTLFDTRGVGTGYAGDLQIIVP